MKRILFLLLLTVSVYGQNPSRFAKIQITGNSNSATATKVNVQEANGEVNTQAINTGFNKNIGLGGSDVVGANTLLNQYSTTPVDWTATAFNSGQVVFYGGKQWIAKMATVAGDVPAVSSKWEELTFEALANKTITVDSVPTDGSNNAVSSNGVFDALATKAPISSVHNPVTIGTANGLSLSTQQLSLGLASSGVTGALSGTDWNTFNGKFNTPTGLTTNYLPKWNGSGFGNSSVFDNGGIDISIINGLYSEFSIKGNQSLDNGGGQINFSNQTKRFATISGETESPNNGLFIVRNLRAGALIECLRIIGNGNVGIGTSTITDRLTVNGTISASPATTANQVVVKSQLGLKADDSEVVHKIGNETISGIKTFNDNIVVNYKSLKITGDDNQGDGQEVSFGINSEGNTEWSVTNINNDKVTLNFNVNDGLNFNKKANFLGTISASPATASNQVVVKSQLDAAARPYKVYTAFYTQQGTANPSFTVLENTIGIVSWSRTGTGTFVAISSNLFTLNKTFITTLSGTTSFIINATTLSSSDVGLISLSLTTGNLIDGINTNKNFVEIRVYN